MLCGLLPAPWHLASDTGRITLEAQTRKEAGDYAVRFCLARDDGLHARNLLRNEQGPDIGVGNVSRFAQGRNLKDSFSDSPYGTRVGGSQDSAAARVQARLRLGRCQISDETRKSRVGGGGRSIRGLEGREDG